MAVFTALQASRLESAQKLHAVRELLYSLKNERALCAADVAEVDVLDQRVTALLTKLIPNAPTAP